MQSKLFIPKKIKVGFQGRSGTFTGKLAYIIYIDEKGVLRKEGSWNSWRNEKLGDIELDNVPQNGYMFNKGIQRDSYHFGSGRSVIRVYDPRDFEFEVSVDNLIGILMNSDVSKRDIVEECVFAWSGKDLILLPVNSKEYIESQEYTKKQSKKVSAKDLKKGYTYSQKKSDGSLVYIGYYEWFESHDYRLRKHMVSKGKKHVFYSAATKMFSIPAVGSLAECVLSEIHSDYSNFVDDFEKSEHSKDFNGFLLKDTKHLIHKEECKTYYQRSVKKVSDSKYVLLEVYNPYLKDVSDIKDNYSSFSGLRFYEYDYIDGKFKLVEKDQTSHYNYYRRNAPVDENLKEVFYKPQLTLAELNESLINCGYKDFVFTRSDGVEVSLD